MVPHAKTFSKEKKWTVQYSNIPLVLRPVPHNEDIPVPEAPELYGIESGDDIEDNESWKAGPLALYDEYNFAATVSEKYLIIQMT